jgi:hypothetical protein
MRVLVNLLGKVTLSSMFFTTPAMINGSGEDAGGARFQNENMPYYSSTVIKKFVSYSPAVAQPAIAAERPDESGSGATSDAKMAETKRVINEAVFLYEDLSLEKDSLSEKAFEYAWRGYHNLLKKGLIRKQNVLSICDFSQSSRNKRMYVIDLRHKRLLYRTYVAHGQNSGGEFANSFSNTPDSYMSSLGFYVTERTYFGRNGLSLKISGVDSGYNDMAGKRNIVLHGSTYVCQKFIQKYGTIGTSLGCPALPLKMSKRIIRAVRGGSCLFIYHPTEKYLEGSPVING